jgi:diguanylate cyclase (GGDEF)-like protein
MGILIEGFIFALSAFGLVACGYLLALKRAQAQELRAEQAEARALLLETAAGKLPASAPFSPPSASPGQDSSTVSTSPSLQGGAGAVSSLWAALDARYLFVSFEEEIRRARSRNTSLTLLTLLLENLEASSPDEESPNSSRLVRGVAHALRGQMRGCDTCIRYAANQFILILPGVSREESRRVERRVRVALQGISCETRSGTSLRPRASLASATFPEDGGSFDQLLTLADSRRSQDSLAAVPGLPAPHPSSSRLRVPPPVLSRN